MNETADQAELTVQCSGRQLMFMLAGLDHIKGWFGPEGRTSVEYSNACAEMVEQLENPNEEVEELAKEWIASMANEEIDPESFDSLTDLRDYVEVGL